MWRRYESIERSIRSVHREPWRPQGNAYFPEVWHSLDRRMHADGDGVNEPEANTKEASGQASGGSVGVLRAWHAWREASRTWETLSVPGRQVSRTRPQAGGLRTERESDPPRVLGERESRLQGEGADGVTQSAQETSTGHVGLEHRCHPHCRGERRKLHVTRHTDVATCLGSCVSSSSSGAGGG